MNPLLHQLARQREAELLERSAQAQSRHDLPRRRTRARIARVLLVVMARARRRQEMVAALIPTVPAGCLDAQPREPLTPLIAAAPAGCPDAEPADIRVIRRDRPGGAPAWRNATCANQESLDPGRGRGRELPRQADIGYPLNFFEIPLKPRDD